MLPNIQIIHSLQRILIILSEMHKLVLKSGVVAAAKIIIIIG